MTILSKIAVSLFVIYGLSNGQAIIPEIPASVPLATQAATTTAPIIPPLPVVPVNTRPNGQTVRPTIDRTRTSRPTVDRTRTVRPTIDRTKTSRPTDPIVASTAAPFIPPLPSQSQTTATPVVPVTPVTTATAVQTTATPIAIPVTPQTTLTPVVPVLPVEPIVPVVTTAPVTPIEPVTPVAPVTPGVASSTTSTTTTTTTTSTTTASPTMRPTDNPTERPTTSTAAPLPIAPVTTARVPVVTNGQGLAAPEGYEFGAYGQLCQLASPEMQCQSTFSTVIGDQNLKCERNGDCCLCQSVTCTECSSFTVGNAGIFGVQNVNIYGESNHGGVEIGCKGTESCMFSVINAENVNSLNCMGALACNGAQITITNPVDRFHLKCEGMGSCQGARIELIIPASGVIGECPPTPYLIDDIVCHDQGAETCKDLEIIIRNNNIGCATEIIKFECLGEGTCDGMQMKLEGDVSNIDFAQCVCGESCKQVTGLEKCYHNLRELSCPDSTTCKGTALQIVNPVDGFMLKCGDIGSCQGSQFDIVLDGTGAEVSHFDVISCSGSSSCQGATFTVENMQVGLPEVVIEKLECGGSAGQGGCNDFTIIIGDNVKIGTVSCGFGQCDNCLIKKSVLDVGLPCAPVMINAPPPNPNAGVQPIVPLQPASPLPAVQQYMPGQIQV